MAAELNNAGRCKFGLLRYRGTENIGDEIQSIAARAFLPRVDIVLDRDRLDRMPSLFGETAVILNGWFSHCPERWPPHPRLRPLLLSMHLSDQAGVTGYSAAEAWVVGRRARYLREHGPVGARDCRTLELLRRHRIDSYFSGCLTLTLARPEVPRREAVVANDLDEPTLTALLTRARAPVITTSHTVTRPSSFGARMALAAQLLKIYAGARCVITTRLHAALPCLAMGTPVLLLSRQPRAFRLRGLAELVHHDTSEHFTAGPSDFDLDAPPPNPTAHIALAKALSERCHRFAAAASAPR